MTKLASRVSLTAVLILAAGVAGCEIELGESTWGELGQVEFSYTSDCLFGCSLERALLPDTEGRISLSDAGDVEGLAASCAAPAVATAWVERSCSCERSGDGWAEGTSVGLDEPCPEGFDKRCDNLIVVEAHRAGDTTLELHHPADGALLDRTTIRVRVPSRGWLEHDGVLLAEGAPLVLQAGRSDGVRARLEDDQGRDLLVTGGVTWTIRDGQVAGFPQWFGPPAEQLITDDIVSIEALSAGSTELSVRAGSFEIAAPLRVSP